jgi:hypothetical protein
MRSPAGIGGGEGAGDDDDDDDNEDDEEGAARSARTTTARRGRIVNARAPLRSLLAPANASARIVVACLRAFEAADDISFEEETRAEEKGAAKIP